MQKKIGIDVRLWDQTGIGRYIRNLLANILDIDRENQYVLFCGSEDVDNIKNQISSSKYHKNVVFVTTNIKWHSVSEQLEFPRLLNRYKLDLMHFSYFSVPVFYKKPFIVTIHDLIINHFPTGKATTLPFFMYKVKRMGYELVLRKAVQNAKKILVPSVATKNEIIDYYKTPIDKIAVTPEGVDSGISDFEIPIFNAQNKYFLFVGNAYPHKNVERLIDAFLLFSKNHPDYVLKLVGKKDYFYTRLEKKTKEKKVEFLNYVTDEELSKLYSRASATFVPSLMEGFGLTALEAMKMKSIVAVSKIPSLVEICKDFAFYFDPTDILSMVSVMEEIAGLKEDEKKKMTTSAKKHSETFLWEKTAELTLAVYNSCL